MNERERALRRLARFGSRRQALDLEELALLGEARKAGATWQQIAERTGYLNRQGAQMRFRILWDRYT